VCLWSMGTALLTHSVSFISVAYFDQIVVFWYMLLGMISACEGIFNSCGGGGSLKNEESRLRAVGENRLTPLRNVNLENG
jgi:hypothetical protein